MKSSRIHYLAVGLFIIGVGALWYFTRSTSVAPALLAPAGVLPTDVGALPHSIISEAITESAPPPDGYIEYRNVKYGFSLYHSPQAKVSEFDEGGGAMTVTLENDQKIRGMQIFIVPYTDSTITEERFNKDVPSGVRQNVKDTLVDGENAVTFNSYTSELGATREVWFIHKGYLYEVTTFQGVGDWFVPIMKTWKFL